MFLRWFRAATAAAAPGLFALAPKCPLCLLPLCAALGISVPPAPLMNTMLAGVAALWIALAYRRGRGILPVAGAATAVIVGHVAGVALISWGGVAAMFVLSLCLFRRNVCHHG